MVLLRKFDERVGDLFRRAKLPGFVHLYIGEEAIATGVCAVLRADDYITSTHRGHGHYIAKGGDVKACMAELFGKDAGCCRGKGGSLHVADTSVGMLGANGIVAANLPIAVGAAYGAAKIRKTDQVVAAFFGDGATNEGAFHEAANLAGAWNLPSSLCARTTTTAWARVSARCRRARASSSGQARMGCPRSRSTGTRSSQFATPPARPSRGPGQATARPSSSAGPAPSRTRGGRQPKYWQEQERNEWLGRDPLRRSPRSSCEGRSVRGCSRRDRRPRRWPGRGGGRLRRGAGVSRRDRCTARRVRPSLAGSAVGS